ncbi:MAG: response regulator [Myxococcota bacterium]|nr:response regulator [Myxococcota bacterium]
MNELDLMIRAAVVLGFAISGVALWRSRARAFGLWMGSWGVLGISGAAIDLGASEIALFGSPLFAALVWMGARSYAGRGEPAWALLVALGAGAVRLAGERSGFVEVSHAVQLGAEAPAILGAAWLVLRAQGAGSTIYQQLLPLGFLCLAAVSAGDAAADLLRGTNEMPGQAWLAASLVSFALQILATVDATRSELRASDERFRRLSEESAEVVAELTPDNRIAYVSPNARAVFGVEASELVGVPLLDAARGFRRYEIERYPRAGELADRIRQERSGLLLRLDQPGGRPVQVEIRAIDFMDSLGERRALLLARDLTQRLQSQDRSNRLRKRESLAVLAGGIAHDFNNLLMSIVGSASLLRASMPRNSEERDLLDDIEHAGERATHLVQQLQRYAGGRPFEPEPVDLSDLVRDAARLLIPKLPPQVDVKLRLASRLPTIDGNATELSQAAINLIQNAAESMPVEGGSIDLRTRLVELTPEELEAAEPGADLPAGAYVLLEIADDGCGMDPATRARMFDPFFSTKGSGHGLGLSAMLGIVRSHGGTVLVQSEPGQGTRVQLYLPPGRLARGARPGSPPLPETPSWGQGTVLLVDDEEDVRRVSSSMLRRFGFEVLEAAAGDEAIERVERHAGDLVAAILDLTMPGMSGGETLDALRARAPTLPILLSSGYSSPEVRDRADVGKADGFVQKPYRQTDLEAELRKVLAAR